MLSLPNGWWLSQVAEIICYSSWSPICVSSPSSASRVAWQWLPSPTSAVCKAGRELITGGQQCQTEESRLLPLLLKPRRMRNMLLPLGQPEKKETTEEHRTVPVQQLWVLLAASSGPVHKHMKTTLWGNFASAVLWFAFTWEELNASWHKIRAKKIMSSKAEKNPHRNRTSHRCIWEVTQLPPPLIAGSQVA